VFLSNGKRRIGFDKSREMSYLFLNERLPPHNPDKHAVERYLDLVKHLGIECENINFPIPITEKEKKKVYGLLKTGGILEGTPFIVVNPMARWETKLWGAQKFAGLCNEMADSFLCTVVVVGTSSEKDNKEFFSLTNNRVVDLTGKTTLKELAHLMSLSSVVITVDSGPMHIAAAMGIPVVALFGSTAPWRTGPYGSIHTIIRKDLPCSPCFSRVCEDKNTICMKEIEVKDVLYAVGAQLKR